MAFTIKTSVKPSAIQWLWVFADESIPEGDIIWKFDPNQDKILTTAQYERLSKKEKSYVYHAQDEWWYVLCWDNAKFTNHSVNPNTQKINSTHTIATKNIDSWDEITENYYHFDQLAQNKLP